MAWEQCGRDWVAAADTRRADLTAQRQATLDSQPCAPHPLPGGPACLAEVLGRLPKRDHERQPRRAQTISQLAPLLPPAPADSSPKSRTNQIGRAMTTMISDDAGIPCASKNWATAVARWYDRT